MSKKTTLDEEQALKMEDIADKITCSISGLVEFQNVIEKVYEKIAFSLPEIGSVIKENDRQAKSMLGMISNKRGQGDIKQKVDGMVIKADHSIDLFSKQMQAMNLREGDLIKQVNKELKNVASMKEILGNIEIILSDIEITTSSALDSADKSGKAVKSFRYLVREVIKISSQSKIIVKNIMTLWNRLAGKTLLFSQIEQGITSMSQEEMGSFCASLHKTFDNAIGHLQNMTESLREIVVKNESVDTAIMSVMEAMQNQDIITQCMDNILLSLNEATYYARKRASEEVDFSGLPEGEKKQMLDEFIFQEEVPNLCRELLGNVEEQLQESNGLLEKNITILKNTVNEDTHKATAAVIPAGNGKDDKIKFDTLLSNARTGIDNWFENFNSSATEKERLLGISNEISILFDKMAKQFLFLRNVTFRFRLIVILSKTELMRTTVLSDHKITQKLNDLTMKIDHFIKQSDERMKKIEEVIRQFMVSFGNNLNESCIKTSVFADEMNTCLESFGDYKGEITRTLGRMTECGQKLDSLFAEFFQGMQQITATIQKNASIKATFTTISAQIGLIRQSFNNGDGESGNWQISDERLLSIINKFTVFSHKKIADEMFDLGLEEGDSGGDLTLF